MATFGRKKPVIIAVLVEKPRNQEVFSSKQHHINYQVRHHHHHHHHLYVQQAKHGGGGGGGGSGGGYNRKAELLNYSHRLRESAQSGSKPASHHNQQPITQIVPVRSKPKAARVHTCFGSLLKPLAMSQGKKKRNSKRSGSSSVTIKAVMNSFQVQKKKGVILKWFASLRKHK